MAFTSTLSQFFHAPLRCLAFLLAMVATPSLCRAALFDWDQSYANNAPAGPAPGNSASQLYDMNADGISDVKVTISNSAANPQTFQWNTGYPVVNNVNNTGGTSPAQRALQLFINRDNSAGVTITVSFATAVTGVSFTLWDIDRAAGTFQDRISNITALTSGSATIGASTVTTSVANTSTGSGVGLVVFGTATSTSTSSNGNVLISFGTNRITQFSFTWTNGDPALSTQSIALHDISFTPLPEVGSSLAAITFCGGAIGFGFLKKRARAKK